MGSILFTQYWDVHHGMFDEYASFINREYNPVLASLNLRLVGGYYVVAGQGPEITAVAALDEGQNLVQALASREYRRVNSKLQRLVKNYSSKVWAPTGHIMKGPYRIQAGVWKFNHYYNLVPGAEEAHYRFAVEEAQPAMAEMGVPITGAWRMVVGAGPTLLAEFTARSLQDIVKAVDTSEFRRLVRKLKKDLITDYSSRILAPTGRIEVPYLMREMLKSF